MRKVCVRGTDLKREAGYILLEELALLAGQGQGHRVEWGSGRFRGSLSIICVPQGDREQNHLVGSARGQWELDRQEEPRKR
jgi:hypothetical protein